MGSYVAVAGALALLLWLPSVATAQDSTVELELRLSSATAPLGRAVNTRFVFTNAGGETTYIRLPRGSELEFNLEVDDCRFRRFEPHGDISIESVRFLYVPLSPGARYETHGTSLNDGHFGAFTIRLPRVGEYQIKLKWRSRAEYVEGAFWPIWNDPIDALPVRLRVGPPDPTDVERWRRVILGCTNEACDEDAVEFFSLVQDRQAAERLAQLFKTEPAEGRFEVALAEAIARQGRQVDVDLLRERADLGKRASSYLWNAWNDLVTRVDGREPCPK